MKKEFGRMAVSQIKNTAKSCYLLTKEKARLEKEIAERQERLEQVNLEWEEYQAPIKRMTGGYTTTDLLNREVVETGKTDKDGRPIKVTNYVLKYPDTIIPPVAEAAENNQDPLDVEWVNNEPNTPGSDFDIDKTEDVFTKVVSSIN